jgi:imidazolonepropionase-like amidohydrolase
MTATVISNARALLPGREILSGARVRVADGRIEAIGSKTPTAPGDLTIDGGGRTLMPGLIDAHLHIVGIDEYDFKKWALEDRGLHAARAVKDMAALVDAGFTTVRDAGSDVAISLKRAQAEGTVRGPRVLASGRWISVTGNLPDLPELPLCCMHERGMGVPVDGPDSCRRAVREQVRAGADVIKIATTGGIDPTFLVAESPMAQSELDAVMDAAHGLGRKVTAHNNVLPGQRPTGILRSVAAGIDAIDHGYYLEDSVLELMAQNGTFWIVTCSYLKIVSENGAAAGLATVYTDRAKQALEAAFDTIPRARRIGVPIAIGSDLLGTVVDPHGGNALELVLMREAGFTDAEVLELATESNARCFDADAWTGSIEPGKAADLILVDGNPDEDVSVLADPSRIPWVMVGGRVLKDELPGGKAA